MRNYILSSVLMVLSTLLFAQAPQKISYQAVIRNSLDQSVTNHAVGMCVSILLGSETGTEVYKEIFNPNPQTNANGLVTIEIGSGIPITGTFSTINWANGPYFLKTETDLTGGTTYNITGTSQILSVPYALYAKTAGSHYIGESYGGGIVFYIYDNGMHGLIAANDDQSTGIRWNNGTHRYTGSTGYGLNAGVMNTALIVATQISDNQTGNFAAKVCADYTLTVGGITYGDWYLPSRYELNLLYLQKAVVGGFDGRTYWSSNELNSNTAYSQSFSNGFLDYDGKIEAFRVRAIRAF